MKTPILVCLSCLLALLTGCAAEKEPISAKISGVVRDAQTDQPIENVAVALTPGDITKVTDNEGRYFFNGLDIDTYTLTYTKEDAYLPKSENISIKAEENELDIVLEQIPTAISPDDDSKYILGKWKEIANGYYHENKIVMSPVDPNGSYREYLNNGKIRDHIVYPEETRDDQVYPEEIRDIELDGTYELDAEYLYIYFNREIYGTGSDRIYTYNFDRDKDELTLELIKGIIPDIFGYPRIHVYKRIK